MTVKSLSELLSQVKDEQTYIVLRERTHRNTAESTNTRVKWWSVFQLGVLVGVCIFQVWWLKRFFEVCRPFLVLCMFTSQLKCVLGETSCIERTYPESKQKDLPDFRVASSLLFQLVIRSLISSTPWTARPSCTSTIDGHHFNCCL